jgi:hypothetical protein
MLDRPGAAMLVIVATSDRADLLALSALLAILDRDLAPRAAALDGCPDLSLAADANTRVDIAIDG